MTRPGQPAVFSEPDRLYRYVLWREWDLGLPYMAVIGLNPSTADEVKNDPTVAKCVRLAKRWNLGALCMLNLFAWRDTDPDKMKAQDQPIGQDNDRWLIECCRGAGLILAAWGNHGQHRGRSGAVRSMLQGQGLTLHALKLNSTMEPQHPLYVREDTQPFVLPSM